MSSATAIPPTVAPDENPAGWPTELLPLFRRAVTAEYASLTRAGDPVTFPVTPYVGDDGRTLDVGTGLTYAAKAERARRNPRVCLLYADPVGSGLVAPPVALVQGLATVRDRDLQANTDRYVRLIQARFPGVFNGQWRFLLRRMDWYLARVWVQVTPLRIRWWPAGRLDEAPREWVAPAGTTAPPSDAAPRGEQPPPWQEAPVDWRATARHAIRRLEHRDLTVVGADGYPACVPVAGVAEDPAGFRLWLARGVPAAAAGPACLTFHTHPEDWPEGTSAGQEHKVFVGQFAPTAGGATFRVERLLGDWSLTGSRLTSTLGMLAKGRRLAPRLRAEAARRGQPVPRVRFPDEC